MTSLHAHHLALLVSYRPLARDFLSAGALEAAPYRIYSKYGFGGMESEGS